MPNRKSQNTVTVVDRRRRALDLRRKGGTYELIAQALTKELKLKSYTRARAYEDVKFALEEMNREFRLEAQELSRLEAEKLDRLEMALWPSAIAGSFKAADSLNRVMERRAKLLGLDAPVRLMVDQGVNQELTTAVDKLQGVMPANSYRDFLAGLRILAQRAEKGEG